MKPENSTLATIRPTSATTRAGRRGAPAEVALGGSTLTSSTCTVPHSTDRASLKSFDLLRAALLRLPEADLVRLQSDLQKRLGDRARVRRDFARYPYLSIDEAALLVGFARQTIKNALTAGRIRRGGSGRYIVDQVSLHQAFRRKARHA